MRPVPASDPTSFRRLLERRRLALFVGEGGVGKTSCAAGLALALAAEGKRVAVLTIDPAPRLGDALGLDGLGTEWQEVRHTAVREAGGRLLASRLDAKQEFDRLVLRFAPSPTVARRVLASPIYAAISGQLGGADSYMAFQQLHELLAEDSHDFLVVDTPPAQHAEEILGAPTRLAKLLETGGLAAVADPARAIARAGSNVAAYTVGLILRALERVTGSELRRELAEFAQSFEAIVTALTRRASEVSDTLRSSESLIIEVVRPDHHSVVAAETLRASLAVAGLAVAFTIVNRMTPDDSGLSTAPIDPHGELSPPAGAIRAEAEMAAALSALRDAEKAAVDSFEKALAGEELRARGKPLRIPSLERGVESADTLLELGRRILRG